MRTETKDGHTRTVYERREEVSNLTRNPPWFCGADATELVYYSFFDTIGRFTLKAYCPKCKRSRAMSVKSERYEEQMLKRWTSMVKERAMWRCEMADENCSGSLHAHHIIPKHLAPSKKYKVENGMCLCERHHKMIHSYM